MLLHAILDRNASEHPDLLFATGAGRTLRYGDAAEQSRHWARALVASGIGVGDRIAVLSPNCSEYLLLYFAASRAGAVVVPLNMRLSGEELAFILRDAAPRAVFAHASVRDRLDPIRPQLPSARHWISFGEPTPSGDEWMDSERWVQAAGHGPDPPRGTPDRDLLQLYTSATTGMPKGAVLTQRAVVTNVHQIAGVVSLSRGDRALVVAPMFHASLVPGVLAPIFHGATLLIHRRFVPADTVDALAHERVAYTLLVPTMIQACLDVVEERGHPGFPHLKLIYYGASPITEGLLRRALATFGHGFIQSYGLTEATQAVTFLTPAEHERGLREQPALLRTAGRAAPETTLRIVDPDDRELPPGAPGEIVVRGPQVMRGYWNRPEETARTLRGGWLHTGDVGSLDEDGYLYVFDRVKDMIISGGENVYSTVVEDALGQHADVAEAAVIGLPHPYWGECVHAVIVLEPGVPPTTQTAERIVAACRERLAGFEVPRSIQFVDDLPQNASGKVLKRLLREHAQATPVTEFAWHAEH